MNNVKLKEIIKFSFYKNIQNRWFVIFNIITLISIIFMINWGSITSIFKPKEEVEIFEIEVLDNSNLVYTEFSNKFSDDKRYEVRKITESNYTAESIPDDLAIIEIKPDEEECFKVSIISKEGIDIDLYNPIKDEFFNIRNNLLANQYSISNENIEILQRDLSVDRVMLSVNAEDSGVKEIIKLFSAALTYLLSTFIFSKMSNEIASEKQSKSTEYILTTVSAKEYLFAKIFANIAILLIQGLFMFAYYFIAVAIFNIINIAGTDLSLNTSIFTSGISKDVIYYLFALIVYNVLNLILLCIIQATLSAKTSSTSEAGNTVSLILFAMMAAYIGTVYLIRPETKVSLLLYIVSCLPLLSAYFVPGMMVVGQAGWLQIIISLIILIIAIPITFNYCSNVFKNGILDYTKVKKNKKVIDKENAKRKFLIKRDMKNLGFVVGLAIIIYIGTQTIFSLLGSIALPTLLGNVLSESEITLVLQIILQVISLGLASLFVISYTDKNKEVELKKILSFKEKTKIVFIAILIIFGLQFILSLIVYPAIGLDYSTVDMFEINSNSNLLGKIILIIAIAVIPAIFEELFFRKALIDFTRKYGKKFALVFSALIFGLLHMNLAQGLFAFIVGLIFGVIYIYTKNIKFTILIHFINNGFAALEMILPEEGAIMIAGILLLSLSIGFGLLIKMIVNKDSRNKLKEVSKIPVSISSFNERYKYIFTDFTFDISMILVGLMSVLTENILR